MQNKLSSTGAEVKKYRCKGPEITELNDTEKDLLHRFFIPHQGDFIPRSKAEWYTYNRCVE